MTAPAQDLPPRAKCPHCGRTGFWSEAPPMLVALAFVFLIDGGSVAGWTAACIAVIFVYALACAAWGLYHAIKADVMTWRGDDKGPVQ